MLIARVFPVTRTCTGGHPIDGELRLGDTPFAWDAGCCHGVWERTSTYVLNALPGSALLGKRFHGEPCSADDVKAALLNGATSAVGHEATAQALSLLFGVEVAFNRASVNPQRGDVLYIAALRGPRLAEGQILTREEVEQRGFEFLRVTIQ